MTAAFRLPVVAGAGLLVCACVRVPKQTELQARVGGDASTQAMRVQVFELGRRALTTIQESADSIRLASSEPEVWRNGLLWKMNSGPAVQEAALQQDPLVAAGESYVLILQMLDFFQAGRGRDAFAGAQPIAIKALQRLEHDAFLTLGRGFPGDSLPARTRDRLHGWAMDHPLHSMSFQRPALAPDWPALTSGVGSGFGGTVFLLDQALAQLSQRLSFLNENLMKQMVWQMQLVTGDAIRAVPMDSALLTGRATLQRLARLADTMPSVMDGQRIALLSNVDSQRVATLLALREEREAVFAGIDRERMATMSDLRGERIAAMAAVDTLLAAAYERTDRLVDRVAVRAAQLVMLVLLATVVVVLLLQVAGRAHERRRSFRAA